MRVSAGTMDREKIRSRKILGFGQKQVEEFQNSGPKKKRGHGDIHNCCARVHGTCVHSICIYIRVQMASHIQTCLVMHTRGACLDKYVRPAYGCAYMCKFLCVGVHVGRNTCISYLILYVGPCTFLYMTSVYFCMGPRACVSEYG